MRDCDDPVVRNFLVLAAADTRWTQAWPRRLLELAKALGTSVTGVDRVVVPNVGFRGAGRPRRLGHALAVIVRRWRQQRRQGESDFIYRDGRNLLVFGEPQRRWGAMESILRPSLHGSPAGPMTTPPEAATPSPPPAPPPVTPRPGKRFCLSEGARAVARQRALKPILTPRCGRRLSGDQSRNGVQSVAAKMPLRSGKSRFVLDRRRRFALILVRLRY